MPPPPPRPAFPPPSAAVLLLLLLALLLLLLLLLLLFLLQQLEPPECAQGRAAGPARVDAPAAAAGPVRAAAAWLFLGEGAKGSRLAAVSQDQRLRPALLALLLLLLPRPWLGSAVEWPEAIATFALPAIMHACMCDASVSLRGRCCCCCCCSSLSCCCCFCFARGTLETVRHLARHVEDAVDGLLAHVAALALAVVLERTLGTATRWLVRRDITPSLLASRTFSQK